MHHWDQRGSGPAERLHVIGSRRNTQRHQTSDVRCHMSETTNVEPVAQLPASVL